MNLVQRSRMVLKRHGIGGLVRLIPANLSFYRARIWKGSKAETSEFDADFRVETAKVRVLPNLV